MDVDIAEVKYANPERWPRGMTVTMPDNYLIGQLCKAEAQIGFSSQQGTRVRVSQEMLSC